MKVERRKTSLFLSIFTLLTLLFPLLLSGCGFHLRGSVTGQVQLPPTYITGEAGALQRELRRYLTLAGTPLVNDKSSAQLIVKLSRELIERRVLSVGSNGKVQEYEVHYAITYAADAQEGAPLIKEQTLDFQRAYTFNESEVLAKQTEQESLVNDMRREAVRQIVRHLQAAVTTPSPPPVPTQ